MKILSFRHKGLKLLFQDDQVKGVPSSIVGKLRKMLAFLQDMDDQSELRHLTVWKAHTLTGDQKGTWSLFVTRNFRLTCRIDAVDRGVADVNLEDFH